MRGCFVLAAAIGLCVGLAGCAHRGAQIDARLDEWQTHAERTNYEETGRYDEVVGLCQRLAASSPYAHYTNFGVSAEGRELPLLILSKDRAFTPADAAQSGKLLVLVQNCIHPGECAGKDASVALVRDILSGEAANLLDEVNLLVMPLFNPDGHERFSPYSRINQNGPKEMGWRVTATNLNLNRDYTKADAVEMRHWLRCWTTWQPDLFFDNHTTNGSDHQYDVFYSIALGPGVDPAIDAWLRDAWQPAVLAGLSADGVKTLEYSFPRDRADIAQGIDVAVGFSPRYSTGYGAVCNRPSVLVEAHALKPYRRRVRAIYSLMRRTLAELNDRPEGLRAAVRAADARCAASRGAEADGRLVLSRARSDEFEPITYHGVESRVRSSDITGGEVIEYSTHPQDVQTKLYNHPRVERSVVPPAAYLVPPQWGEVIARLEMHGIEFFRLARAEQLEVEIYQFEDVEFRRRPFEGLFQPRYQTRVELGARECTAGTVVVPMYQPRAKIAAHLLEPQAPDALVAWGLFNAVFEQKEYAEAYVMEPLAQQMLAADANLRAEFEEKLRTDPAFAGSPGARLNFLYRRSPYWDEAMNVYPVVRLLDGGALGRLAGG